jgi:hypothetical protein|tara:strand:- start:150 stop:350 length:201 start_codon:yes stop_codon:yes gene_type:complete
MKEIDITGSEGNAFMLIGQAKQLAKQLDMDAKAIADEMKAGDYEHLLDVFEKHFGSFIKLVWRDDD